MNRRQFSLLVAAGMTGGVQSLFAEESAGAEKLVEAAASAASPKTQAKAALEHWRAAHNSTWKWFEKSQLIDGKWRLVTATSPEHRKTGERKTDVTGYIADAEVPTPLLNAKPGQMTDFCVMPEGAPAGPSPTAGRRARDGRPPSHWVRGLSQEELRVWLTVIDPPEAGVAGMTFLEHLTEGHSFELSRVEGLTLEEQAKLHGAVHHGF